MGEYLAVDVGGTKIAIGLGTDTGQLLETAILKTPAEKAPQDVLDQIADQALAMVHRHGVALEAVGVGSPGPLDGPVLLKTSNLSHWEGLNWETGLNTRLHVPVYVENDATAAAVGEWMFGAGKGTRDLVYVTISTGIGAGFVVNGRVMSGFRGNAGEFGHLVLDPAGPWCPAGHYGCVESYASGSALTREGRRHQKESPYLDGKESVDAKTVLQGWMRDDPVCGQIVDAATERLGRGLSYLIDLMNPERIIVGGGVGVNAPERYLTMIESYARQYALPAMMAVVQFRRAQLGEQSGVMGALAVAINRQHNPNSLGYAKES